MREYELMAVYDLVVTEEGGEDASVEHLTGLVERYGGSIVKVDHWGRRRLAYPINKQLDADFIVTRVELDPQAVTPLNADFEIEERVYRHLVVRADELPPPRAPTLAPAGPRGPGAPTGPPAASGAATPPAGAPAAEGTPDTATAEATVPAVEGAEAPAAAAEAAASAETAGVAEEIVEAAAADEAPANETTAPVVDEPEAPPAPADTGTTSEATEE